MSFGRGTYWLTIWFGGKGWGKDVCWKTHQSVLLRSESGKPEGPYKLHMIGPDNIQGVFFDDDGSAYLLADTPVRRLNDDLTAIDENWTERDGKTVPRDFGKKGTKIPATDNGRRITEDCNFGNLVKSGKRYGASGLTGMNSYDGLYHWAEDIRGPWHYMGVLPFRGNSNLVKDKETGHWIVWPQVGAAGGFFFAPIRPTDKWTGSLINYEVTIDLESDKPSIWPTHDLGHLDEAVYRK